MSLYDRCLSIVDSKNDMLIESSDRSLSTYPIREQTNDRYDTITVYYISDIHLEHQIIREFPNGASDEQIKEFITKLVSGLLTDDIVSPYFWDLIFFGGDIASDYSLSELFYTDFIKVWDKKSRTDHQENQRKILTFFQEQEKIENELNEWENSHKWVQTATKDLLEYSDKRVPAKVKEMIIRDRELEELIVDKVGKNKLYYAEEWRPPKKRIIAVLGNHELWNFGSLKECVNAYRKVFKRLGIVFLNNNGVYISSYYKSVVAIGGIGFSGYNDYVNANNGLYRDTLDREEEIKQTKRWESYYKKTVKTAKENNDLLVVFTHNPPHDWSKQKRLDGNCAYFYGHNHKNTAYYIEDTNTYMFADNQIGYKNANVSFKKASLFVRTNPFADYEDGVYQVSLEDYFLFNRFCNILIHGTKLINKYIENGSKFYMIKEKCYYGFFLVAEKKGTNDKGKSLTSGTFICAGGVVKKISSDTSIKHVKDIFYEMVQAYIKFLTPYRNAQEEISKAVKAFGGDGTIHGYIIDIDFFDHIMLNPDDGNITYYYSPIMGVLKPYDTLQELLSEHNPECLKRYLEQNNLPEVWQEKPQSKGNKGFTFVDIRNSPYAGSRRMNQLQRLFEAKVLRDWDESVLSLLNDRLE